MIVPVTFGGLFLHHLSLFSKVDVQIPGVCSVTCLINQLIFPTIELEYVLQDILMVCGAKILN
jgi:hypothetical protein